MKEDYTTAIKLMVYAQSFVETLEEFKGSNAYRQRLKQRANQFSDEMDKFLNSAYCKGQTESSLIYLIDECQKDIEQRITNEVEIVE